MKTKFNINSISISDIDSIDDNCGFHSTDS